MNKAKIKEQQDRANERFILFIFTFFVCVNIAAYWVVG